MKKLQSNLSLTICAFAVMAAPFAFSMQKPNMQDFAQLLNKSRYGALGLGIAAAGSAAYLYLNSAKQTASHQSPVILSEMPMPELKKEITDFYPTKNFLIYLMRASSSSRSTCKN